MTTTIQSIKNNDANRTFFENRTFHEDMTYSVIPATKEHPALFRVDMKDYTTAYYRLTGSRIGAWYPFEN